MHTPDSSSSRLRFVRRSQAALLAALLTLAVAAPVAAAMPAAPTGPEMVSDDAGGAAQLNPYATTGRDGNVYAIWVDSRNSASAVDAYFAARNASTGTWSANELVDDAGVAISSPALAVDAQGNAYAVWVDARLGDKDIWFSKRSAASGEWSAAVRVNDDRAGAVQDWPSIAVTPGGEAIAIWVDQRSRRTAVYSARLAAGATHWSANYQVSSDTKLGKTGPRVALSSDGTAYAIWDQYKRGVSAVRFTTLAPGGTAWASDIQVSQSSKFSMFDVGIGVDGIGNLQLVYTRDSVVLWARTRSAGDGSWGTPVTVSSTGDFLSPSVSVRADGVAYVAWKDVDDQVYGARYDPATPGWSAPEQVVPASERQGLSMALTVDQAIVVSADYVTDNYDILAYPHDVP